MDAGRTLAACSGRFGEDVIACAFAQSLASRKGR